MNREIGERWIAELKSGKYTQGSMFLATGGKNCCLGVLCLMAEEAGVISPTFIAYDGRRNYSGCEASLPEKVQEWAEMKSWAGHFGIELNENLAYLNDQVVDKKHLYPFEVIADIIEKEMDNL